VVLRTRPAEILSILRRNRWFESTPLQRRVCKPSIPPEILERHPHVKMVETRAELPFIGDQVVCLSHDQAARRPAPLSERASAALFRSLKTSV
jgi:hypothetical protein